MADTHRIILTADALSDLNGIAAFIREHSVQNAATMAETILDAIDSLGSMPERFKQVGTSRKRGTPVHAMVVRPFIVYHGVEKSTAAVYVLSIRHGRRRQPRRFK